MKEKLNDSIKQEKKRKKKCEVSKMCFFPCELVKLTLYFLYFFYSTLMPPKSDKGETKNNADKSGQTRGESHCDGH